MQAAARAGVAVVVLDRPNPLGGVALEGGSVEPACESFVGLGAVPVRHGMTAGEIARLVRVGLPWGGARFAGAIDCDLTVVAMRGWRRAMAFEETGLPWVMPSPNMPTVDTAFVYPGQCLVEGTNLSEARGTTRPFELVGAPFLDGHRLATRLAALDLPGVRFRPVSFLPMFHKFAGRSCGGVQLHVTDRARFQPYRASLALLAAARAEAPADFRWRRETYEFVSDPPAIDLLTGSAHARRAIDAGGALGETMAALVAGFASFEGEFAERRRPHLLPEYA
jgi:uncharacterized protein YbbC (DUF1343 family)